MIGRHEFLAKAKDYVLFTPDHFLCKEKRCGLGTRLRKQDDSLKQGRQKRTVKLQWRMM